MATLKAAAETVASAVGFAQYEGVHLLANLQEVIPTVVNYDGDDEYTDKFDDGTYEFNVKIDDELFTVSVRRA